MENLGDADRGRDGKILASSELGGALLALYSAFKIQGFPWKAADASRIQLSFINACERRIMLKIIAKRKGISSTDIRSGNATTLDRAINAARRRRR